MRWVTFNVSGMPSTGASTATAVAVSIFNLSGLVNVVLILFTRTNVLLLGSGGVPTDVDGRSNRDSMDTQELERYTGISRTASHRHRVPTSTENRVPDMSSVPNSPIADTGFGGPIVRLRFDDSDSEDGGMGADGSSETRRRRTEARNGDEGLSAEHDMIGGPSTSSTLPRQILLPDIPFSEARSPGREYLESLGVRTTDRPIE